jgi:hypothetical protein
VTNRILRNEFEERRLPKIVTTFEHDLLVYDCRMTLEMIAQAVDVLYQDIAQRDQARIFTKNAARFLRPGGTGILMLKSRSISVAKEPDIVYGETASALMQAGLDVATIIPLEPWERDHAAIIVTKGALDPVSRMPEFKVCAVRLESHDPNGDSDDA